MGRPQMRATGASITYRIIKVLRGGEGGGGGGVGKNRSCLWRSPVLDREKWGGSEPRRITRTKPTNFRGQKARGGEDYVIDKSKY